MKANVQVVEASINQAIQQTSKPATVHLFFAPLGCQAHLVRKTAHGAQLSAIGYLTRFIEEI